MAYWKHRAADDYLWLHDAQMHCLMKYCVQHQYGISLEYNMYNNHPWHIAGQGATDAALWYIALSDLLINAYHSQFQPCILHDPTLTLHIIKSIKAFIDDVAMSAGDWHTPLPLLVDKSTSSATVVESACPVFGRCTEHQKCCCTFYYWQLTKMASSNWLTPVQQKPKYKSNLETHSRWFQSLQQPKGHGTWESMLPEMDWQNWWKTMYGIRQSHAREHCNTNTCCNKKQLSFTAPDFCQHSHATHLPWAYSPVISLDNS